MDLGLSASNGFGSANAQINTRGGAQSTNQTVVMPELMGVYNQTLGLNQQNYNNMLNAYQTGGQNLAQSMPGVYRTYDEALGNIKNILGYGGTEWGVANPAAKAVGDTFKQANAANQKQLIDTGLSGSSILSGERNQNALMAGRAYDTLGSELAQTYAGYDAQVEMAKAASQMQGAGMQSQFAQNFGGALAGFRFANQAGNLTGNVGQSTSLNQPVQRPGINYSGGGGGRIGSGPVGIPGDVGGYEQFGAPTTGGGPSGYNPFVGTNPFANTPMGGMAGGGQGPSMPELLGYNQGSMTGYGNPGASIGQAIADAQNQQGNLDFYNASQEL